MARKIADLEKMYNGIRQVLQRRTLSPGPILGGAIPPVGEAIPSGAPLRPYTAPKMTVTPPSSIVGPVPETTAQKGTRVVRGGGSVLNKTRGAGTQNLINAANTANRVTPLTAAKGVASKLAVPLQVTAALQPLAAYTARKTQEAGQGIPTMIASQTQPLPSGSIEAPQGKSFSTMSIANKPMVMPAMPVPSKELKVQPTFPKTEVQSEGYTESFPFGLGDYEANYKEPGTKEGDYGVSVGGKFYPMGSEESQGALNKYPGQELTLKGTGPLKTPEQRAAEQNAIDDERVQRTTQMKAERLADEELGSRRQLDLDKNMALARMNTPWYAGGTVESRQQAALQLGALQKEAELQNDVTKAGMQNQPRALDPSEVMKNLSEADRNKLVGRLAMVKAKQDAEGTGGVGLTMPEAYKNMIEIYKLKEQGVPDEQINELLAMIGKTPKLASKSYKTKEEE